MIHIPIGALLAAVVWHYDPEIRKWVNKHAGPHITKFEGHVKKIYQKARRRKVNTETTDSQE